MKNVVVIVFIFITSFAHAMSDTVRVKDFSTEWMFYEGTKSLPLVKKSDFKGHVVYFEMVITDLEGVFLHIKYPDEFAVLVDNVLIRTASGVMNITIEELGTNKNTVEVSIYSSVLNPYLLSTEAYKVINSAANSADNEVVLVNPKNETVFRDFYVTSITVLLLMAAVIYSFFRRPLGEYFRLSRAISAREQDENLLKSRPFTRENISIYTLLSALSAQLIISIVHLAQLFPERPVFYPQTFSESIWNWVMFTGIIFFLICIKYMFLSFFTYIFDLKEFINGHFFNSLRLSLMTVSVISLVLALTYLGFYHYYHAVYLTFYYVLLFGILPTIVIIFVKLMETSSFKNLHLFSYLCGTELVPYVIILSLGIY